MIVSTSPTWVWQRAFGVGAILLRVSIPALCAMLLLVQTGCGGDPDGGSPPADPVETRRWLEEGQYLQWERDTGLKPATEGEGYRRVYLDPSLTESIGGSGPHPVGAAAVREIYGPSGEQVLGHAMMVKLADDGHATDWFFFEIYGLEDPTVEPLVSERGAPACVGCHQDGVDYVQPLDELVSGCD